MAYIPVYSPASGDVISATGVDNNDKKLQTYLHQVETSAFNPSQWVNTQHIQAPVIIPLKFMQEGVSGMVAGLPSVGPFASPTFASSSTIGGSAQGADPKWDFLPGTCIEVTRKRSLSALYHWWAEVQAGPDDGSHRASFPVPLDRVVQITPYSGVMTGVDIGEQHALDCPNAVTWDAATPRGPKYPYARRGSALMSGVYLDKSSGRGRRAFGLAVRSQISRVAVINFGWTLELFYL